MKYIQKIIIFFYGGSVNYHSKKSGKIFNIFTNTVNKLKTQNSSIDEEIVERNAVILFLQDESEKLVKLQSSNKSMINKINHFIAPEPQNDEEVH